MLVVRKTRNSLNNLFQRIRLENKNKVTGRDKSAKIEQIIAYLEILHASIRRYSRKRELTFIDCGAGNCYLSFLVYFFYCDIDGRNIRIHCLDSNEQLMEKNRRLAETLGFDNMFFHACDISEYEHTGRPEMVYSLHACDSATDKTLYLGLKTGARNIMSVSCCQHTIKKKLRAHPYTGLTRHRVFKEKLAYMMGDSLRAILMEMQGYNVDIVQFVSSRATDKNVMLRAKKAQVGDIERLTGEYLALRETFRVVPALEQYLVATGDVSGFPGLRKHVPVSRGTVS